MQYFFILGNNTSISTAEICAVLPKDSQKLIKIYPHQQVLFYDGELPYEPEVLIKRLGGTIKIGKIVNIGAKPADFFAVLSKNYLKLANRFNFGFSDYTGKLHLKTTAMEFKKFLKEQNVPCRWVISREPVLSSVVVEQNDLLTKGAEFVFFRNEEGYLIGKTSAIQPFKELSRRDFGRPARDDHSGMLPPKLAQIMLNLANINKDSIVLDPFCGSGTVMSEAALMGVENIYASDISQKAVADSKINIEWLRERVEFKNFKIEVNQVSAAELSKTHSVNSIDVIVTEPYLGPQRGLNNIRAVVKELENLYKTSIEEFYKILKPHGRVVMLWPVFWDKKEQIKLNTTIAGRFKLINPVPDNLLEMIQLTERKTLVYGRAEQRVWREIIILEK